MRDNRDKPYAREFRNFLEALRFLGKYYKLSVSDAELTSLSRKGLIRTKHGVVDVATADVEESRYPVLPHPIGQSALCYAWRSTTHFVMPPVHRKRKEAKKMCPPPLSPKRTKNNEHAYPAIDLGGVEDEVQSIVADFPVWSAEVISELMRWGAKPKLVEINHVNRCATVPLVSCTFAQPDGQLVRNVVMQLDILRLEYPGLTAHLK